MSKKFRTEDGFTVIDPTSMKETLSRKLVPVADRLRDLNTRFGLRNYIVRIVKTCWTGGKRGLGDEELVWIENILPTPRVLDLGSLAEIVTPIGLNEVNSVQIDQISGRYTEEFLLGIDKNGNEPAPDENVYYEVEFPRGDGRPSRKRRFHISSVPDYRAVRCQWSIDLTKAYEDRSNTGEPV